MRQPLPSRRARNRWNWGRKAAPYPVLAAILIIQASLSVRLIRSNTAFLDEATYLSAGRQLTDSWLHGGSNLHYATYFSGAPVIYPVIAAFFDRLGGLDAARYFSLACMLIATTVCYSTARKLFGVVAGLCAAAAFVTTQGTQYLGAFATYDAMALMLTVVAAWIVVRYADRAEKAGVFYLAAPVMAFADATKYASAIFDLGVIGLGFMLILDRRGFRVAFRCTVILTAVLVMVVSLLMALAGPAYLAGITSTTLTRASGGTAASIVLHDSGRWVGVIAAIAVVGAIGAVVATLRGLLSWPRAGLLGVCAATVLLAPVNQARIHTGTSLSKHVTFGAWFGALAVGYVASQLAGRDWQAWVVIPALGVLAIPLGIAGTHQADRLYNEWPNSTATMAVLKPLVDAPNSRILMDDAEVGTYYDGTRANEAQWFNTYYLAYLPPGATTPLTGLAAYTSAIQNNYFSVVALDYGAQHAEDAAVAAAISANKHYHFVAAVPTHDVFGKGSYVIWRYEATTS